MFMQYTVFATLLAVCYCGYPIPGQYGAQSAPSPAENYSPIPYNYGYSTVDNIGTKTTRQESGDGNGAVKGSYSYVDAQGISRIVEYIADAGGFRANIRTNEPGTESNAPANVILSATPVAVPAIYSAPVQAAIPAQLPSWPPRAY